MSTANLVPETWELTGDDARETLQRTGIRQLFRDAFARFRWSDGTSHARSLGYTVSLVLIQGIIAVVGLATAMGESRISAVIRDTFQSAVPGPAGEIVTSAIDQARQAGAGHRNVALVLGLVGALVTGTTAVAQLERSLNRLYGVETDRPTGRKYALAFLLAMSAGLLGTGAFIAIAFGRSLGETFTNETVADIWTVVRWPLGLLLSMGAIALLFKVCPRRHQPAWSWLAYGATAAVVLWVAVTAALGLFFRLNDSFGEIYGPLAGVLALLLWAFLSALAVLFGAALAAQLEAVRAGAARPQDTQKVVTTEPDTRVLAPSAIAGR